MAGRLFVYELFNIKNHDLYNSHFENETGLRSNKISTSNKKVQLQFIKNILTIYDINFKILNQIIVYCNNKQHREKFKEFHSMIRMLRISDSLYNNNFGLAKKLEIFDKSLSKILNKNNKAMRKKYHNSFLKNRKKLIYYLESKANENLNSKDISLLTDTYESIYDEHIHHTKKMYDQTHDLITNISTLHMNSDIKLPMRQFKQAIFNYAICVNYFNIHKVFELINKYIDELNIKNNVNIHNNIHTDIFTKKRIKL